MTTRTFSITLLAFSVLSLLAAVYFQSGSTPATAPPASPSVVAVKPLVPLAPRTSEEEQNIAAYKKTNRAVVNIRTATLDYFSVASQSGTGSGVIIDVENALVITNFHVIQNADKIFITLADGSSFAAKLIGQDPDTELALLQIKNPPDNLVSLELGSSSNLAVGQRVLAIGNPFGLNRSLTTGIISSLGRTIRSQNDRLIEDVIQTDAAINPGNSGGPLLDSAGRVIGINTAIVSRSGESAGIGFAIPVDQIKEAIPQLVKFGRVRRPKIGVLVIDTEYGVALQHVAPKSPAEAAGLEGALRYVRRGMFKLRVLDLRKADFILAINGEKISTKTQAITILGKLPTDRPAQFKVRRGLSQRNTTTIEVTPILR